MLETAADPGTIRERLLEMGLKEEEVDQIMEDIEAQRQAMNDELYNHIGDSEEEIKKRPEPLFVKKGKAILAAAAKKWRYFLIDPNINKRLIMD